MAQGGLELLEAEEELDGLEFFEGAPPPRAASATATGARLLSLAPKTGHDSGPIPQKAALDLERARLADVGLDADLAHERAARAATWASLGISLSALALTLGGGLLAARGAPAAGAALFLAGAPTTLLALSTLVCAARGERGGPLFALASVTTLAAVAASTALFAVGG